jgi:hypothetical protein
VWSSGIDRSMATQRGLAVGLGRSSPRLRWRASVNATSTLGRDRAVGDVRRRDWELDGRLLLTAIVVAEVLLLFLLLDGDGWVRDDNYVLAAEGTIGFGWHWLTAVIFSHWGISYNAIVAVVHQLMPIDNRWALAGMLVVLAGSIVLMESIVRTLFGRRWLAVGVAASFGLSVLFVRPLQWWAGGLQYLPNTFCDLLCLYAYLRFQREHSRRWAVVGAIALAVGLSFYEKPAYMLLYLLALRVLLLSRSVQPRVIARAIWGERVFWCGVVGVFVVWGVAYLLVGGGSGAVQGHVGVGEYLSYLRVVWVETLVPAVFDVTLPAGGLSTAQIVLAAVLQVVAVGAILLSFRCNRGAWRAWSFLAIALVANCALVAYTRLAPWGPWIGNDPRYLLDFAWLVPLATCFAYFPSSLELAPAAGRDRSLRLSPRWRPGVLLAVAALAVYCGAAVATSMKMQRQWDGRQARSWEARLQQGIASIRAHGPPPVIADGTVPWYIIDTRFAPANRLSWVAPLFVPGAQIDGVLNGPLVTIGSDGTVHRAIITTRTGAGVLRQLLRSGQATIKQASKVKQRGAGTCISAGTAQASIIRRLPTMPSQAPAPSYLLLTYDASEPANLPVFIDPPRNGPWEPTRGVTTARGGNASILFLPAAPRRILVRINPGTTVCIDRFAIVTLKPAD